MKTVTVCTANMHNLFVLYRACFKAPGQYCYEELPQGFRYLPSSKEGNQMLNHHESRELAALALKRGGDNPADVVILQEVESMTALDTFNKEFMGEAYPYTMLVAGHYERLVNVGVMSMHPIMCTRSHKDERDAEGSYLFSRDCLEVTVDVYGTPLTIFANHFKSRSGKTEEERNNADSIRQRQAERVAEIVRERFPGKLFRSAAFIIAGDLNDTPDSTALQPLFELGMENVISRLPDHEQWTHYWAAKGLASQIDYVLLSPALSKTNSEAPYIERRGLPQGEKAVFFHNGNSIEIPLDFKRFPRVHEKVFASDHAFVFFSAALPR